MRALTTFDRFVGVEAASGLVLLAAAAIALVWANSPAAALYHAILGTPLYISAAGHSFSEPLHFWINDVLMTVFFLVAGMEIRRELHEGALASLRQAVLPVVAAIGGVLTPALIYWALHNGEAQRRGWAIPTATDIAFAVGVLALLGKAVPGSVRALLLALAIIDDIIAILIIAVFYSRGIDYHGLLIALFGVFTVWVLQKIGIGSASVYILPGSILWFGLFLMGVHPTLAGVGLGLLTPVRPNPRRLAKGDAIPPVVKVQSALHPWVAFGIMPLFALANAGVDLHGVLSTLHESRNVFLGVLIALVAGKPAGVITACWLAVRYGWCRLPTGLSWSGIYLLGLLAGIGFTMSIFVAALAFTDHNLLAAAKLGILLGSLLSGILGLAWGKHYIKTLRAAS